MLPDGMRVNVGIGNGWTALYRATKYNLTDVTKRLLHEGANVTRQSPLFRAARYNNT